MMFCLFQVSRAIFSQYVLLQEEEIQFFLMTDLSLIINPNKQLVATGSLNGDLFVLDVAEINSNAYQLVSNDADLWHQRLGHCGVQRLRQMKFLAKNIKLSPKLQLSFCDGCAEAKQTRKSFS